MNTQSQFIFLIIFALFISACGPKDRTDSIVPSETMTCAGTAITSKYIVHFHSGAWDYVENSDRENFKETYVRPQINEIDFIEYDQKIFLDSPLGSSADNQIVFAPSNGIDNWGIQVINAPAAWQKGHRGKGVMVAVIDTGVDFTHSQLSSRIAYNEGEAGSKQFNGIDDDNNGFIDDYAGYNFADNNSDVSDFVGHGTHVSGVIAASHNDTIYKYGDYVQGIAPEANILPVKFLGGQNGSGTLAGALKGIDYAIQRGARVINASWGGNGCSQSLRQKVSEALSKNVLFITASGNSGNNLELYPEYPAAFNLPLQITVGSISSSLEMDYYSNYSRSYVHIFAPGNKIVSTMPSNNYASLSGTSMAAPFVTAAAAVLLGAKSTLSLAQVRRLLFGSAIIDPNYINYTRGRLNLGQSVDALSHIGP
ncbi:MAG: hypothetical protein A2Z20_01795 [Bdellovibrionales bacterium RBG_16_40_8]|nr:MAG: hypothetical protein A2Z20_01795 [Bdellovibrionales bacterium RBG_16_40_8]